VLEGDVGVFPSKGIDRGQLANVNPASLKEQGAIEARVSRSAYIVCETTSGNHSVILISERDGLDGGCDCFEVLASHIEPSLIGYVYSIGTNGDRVKDYLHFFLSFSL
tara:strand:+ start:243 stop:566 length:324 start_codon:yes stop_codon:yes gene_type:complete